MHGVTNSIKTVVLLGALMGLFVAVGGMMGREYMLPALLLGGVMNFIAFFFSDTIAIKSMRGRELTAETGGDLYRMIERLSQRAGLPMPRVYLCPHQAPNAFATGRSPRKGAVAFTQGAIDLLSPAELEGVAAHELAHIRNRDTLTSTIAATVAGTLAWLAQWGYLFMGGRRENANPIVGLLVVIIAAVGAALIQAMISRTREYAADAEAAAMVGSPDGLIGALSKLDAMSRRVPLVQPNPAQNNLFIVEPLAGGRALTSMFATHPPTQKRIEALSRLR